jgi:phenylalanine-4-hydroxylase
MQAIGEPTTRDEPDPYHRDPGRQGGFVIDSYDDLLRQTVETDGAPRYRIMSVASDFDADANVATDRVYKRGTQPHVRASGAHHV